MVLQKPALVFTDTLFVAHPQRTFSCQQLDPRNMPNDARKRAATEPPLQFTFQDAQLENDLSLSQSPELKAGPFLPFVPHSDHEPAQCHADVVPNQLQLHLGEISLPRLDYNTEARLYSSHFPRDHYLDSHFVHIYQLEDELGSGGYGFVMTAYHRMEGFEVAVKFIVKDKVPEHAWTEDQIAGRVPTEIVLLKNIHHKNIVKCMDVFEDDLYYYLVQELHGSPWHKDHKLDTPPLSLCTSRSGSSLSTPALSPTSSEASLPVSQPSTPSHPFTTLHLEGDVIPASDEGIPKLLHSNLSTGQEYTRPGFTRRPSHDLFECIEQSEHKKLTEDQARHVFAQVVEAVYYLHSCGIIHRDIKDENLVIDKKLKVKLIDFGSAIALDLAKPPPDFQMFYGTAAYASSEILLKQSYQAAPAEIWTLGILLSYLLAGVSPFPTVRDAVDGRIFLCEKIVGKISDDARDLMRQCLDPNPQRRATIAQVKEHHWMQYKHPRLCL